jgi:sulfur carrier protein ThiS
MQITLKLFASLGEYLPVGSRDNMLDIEVGSDETVGEIIERLNLPQRLVHLVLVNGVYLAPAERRERCLAAGDQLAVWPPIAGG